MVGIWMDLCGVLVAAGGEPRAGLRFLRNVAVSLFREASVSSVNKTFIRFPSRKRGENTHYRRKKILEGSWRWH
jgi:hypothetical protein